MELTPVNKDCLCCYRQVRNSRKFQAPCWDSTSVYDLSLYTKGRVATGQSIQNQEVRNKLESLQRALLLYSYLVLLWHQHEVWRTLKNSLRYTFKLYISWASITQYNTRKILFMKETTSTALSKPRLHMYAHGAWGMETGTARTARDGTHTKKRCQQYHALTHSPFSHLYREMKALCSINLAYRCCVQGTKDNITPTSSIKTGRTFNFFLESQIIT